MGNIQATEDCQVPDKVLQPKDVEKLSKCLERDILAQKEFFRELNIPKRVFSENLSNLGVLKDPDQIKESPLSSFRNQGDKPSFKEKTGE